MAELKIQLKGVGGGKPPVLLRRFSERMKPQLKKGLRQGASHLTKFVKDLIGRPGFTRNPMRSSPYPGINTGRMRGSLRWEFFDNDWGVRIGPNVHYAVYLEHGTKHMPARPFMADTLKFQGKRAVDMIQTTLMKAMDR